VISAIALLVILLGIFLKSNERLAAFERDFYKSFAFSVSESSLIAITSSSAGIPFCMRELLALTALEVVGCLSAAVFVPGIDIF